MTPFERASEFLQPRDTGAYDLKFFPSLDPHVCNNQDSPAWGWPSGPEISDCNLEIVTEIVKEFGSKCQLIMEIGVHRNNDRSITNILMDQKPLDCVYFGVDLDDKSHLNDLQKNIYTFKSTSHDQLAVRKKLRSITSKSIDILMIDGWHSVNSAVNDWCYADLVSPHGIVIVHDTNAHPGPIALFYAVDDSKWIKVRHCTSMDDMGIATFRRK